MVNEYGASSLQNGASCLLNVRRVVLGSLRKNRRSVGQNRQISGMSGKFCQFAGQCVRRKVIKKKMHRQYFGVTWSSIDEDSTYFLHIFHDIYCVY